MSAAAGAAPLVLGVDVGTTTTKALLLDQHGEEVARRSVPTPFSIETTGTEMTVPALKAALAALLAGLGPAAGRVMAVGVAGLAESGAPFDRHGEPLAPVIAWHDPRGEATVARLERRFGAALVPLIGQRLRSVSSVAKLGWLLDEGLRGVHRWLGVPELCLFALTGAWATDYSLASRTGCYDVGRRRWLPEVAEAVGVDPGVLPPVHRAGAALGRVTTEAAAWSGLVAGIPVTLAGHDHLAAMSGCGAAADDLGNSVGTAETVVGRSDRLPDAHLAVDRRSAITLAPAGDRWAVLASAARAGRVLERAATALGRTLPELDALAETARPIAADELVVALQSGDASGLDGGDPGALWAGLMRALAVRTADAVNRVGDVIGPAPRLVVFGGGSRSRPWLAAKADVCPIPISRSSTADAAARGAASYAGVAAGWWASADDAPQVATEAVTPGSGATGRP